MTGIVPGIVTDIGAVADAIAEGEELAGKIVDATKSANDKQAGVDAATAKGQADALREIDLAKRSEVAMQTTAANPDAGWADSVRDQYRRPD